MEFTGRAITHTLAFGISQAGRYLRDHIAQGFNADEGGTRVFDGVLTHVAGIGRVFLNTPFAQPFRTRTWHEDHDFPEVEFPFSSTAMSDPLTGATGGLMRGDASDPKLIETNTPTEYWQKGASIFINGQIYRGFNGSAGEFGHMTVDEDGPLCCCGSYGCLEALATCTTIIDSVRAAIEKGVASKILELAGGDATAITIEIIGQAAEQNDSLAYRALSEAASHIGAATADLVNLLNPQAIIFGGALFRSAPTLLLEQVRRVVRHRAMEKSANDVSLKVSPLQSDAGSRGMARLIAATLLESIYLTGLAS